MRTVSLSEFRKRSTAVAYAAEAGETIVITDRGRPIAKIVQHQPEVPPGISREDSDAMSRTLQGAGDSAPSTPAALGAVRADPAAASTPSS